MDLAGLAELISAIAELLLAIMAVLGFAVRLKKRDDE